VTTIYYLLHKRYEREGKLASSFKVEQTPIKNESRKKDFSSRKEERVSVSPVKKTRRKNSDCSGVKESQNYNDPF
jgi:hypothetical protein